jgi:TRAP-type uncharacterized transport system substrate-binding protein
MSFRILSVALLIVFVFSACGSRPQKQWSIAVPINNSKYEVNASLLQELFESEGLELEIIQTTSSIESNRLVASGEADFTMTLAHSDFLIPKLGELGKELRIVMPLFENAIFLFHRKPSVPNSIIELAENSRIFLEVPDSLSEQSIGLQRLFKMLNVKNYEFVQDSSLADVMPVWGTFSGDMAKIMLEKKWSVYSMEEPFIEYALLIEPRFGRLVIPGRYSHLGTKGISTLLSTAFLVTGSHVDHHDLYTIIKMLYDNRVFFTSHEKSYMAIREDFSTKDLNFPLHSSAAAYLARNEPTFLERNAEYYGLILSVLIIVFGAIQSFRNYVSRKKKDRIDMYFQEYLAIKNDKSSDTEHLVTLLEELHTKAINQMISEKLDISDFNTFSQTIKADISNLTKG